MKFAVCKTSDIECNDITFKKFNSIEEILEFKKKMRYPLIILDYYVNSKGKMINHPTIEIYDDYRE